ncbi:lysosome membrane protein 2 [Protopterus annectens]|uniref:lysosome membrane protein 2 n=1 Tax=Protopterus annectens TaxID=7888 RepID=UPI001CFAA0FD|nr:lysosome membrane protein 2 [Protopterus annectens]
MNGTDDGRYVILTGEQDYHDFARVIEWQDDAILHWWTSDICNMINGTDGSSFHPLITKKEKVYIFSSDLCRSLYAIFERTVYVKGVTAFRFVLPPNLFANASVNPDNAGFCVPSGNCLGSGVLNVSICKQDAPIMMSSPHFYQGDQKYIDNIIGMHPTKEEHETYLDINPLTGILIRAAKRLQVNVHVQKIAAFSETGNARMLIFPVMYINESVLIDDESAKKLKSVLLLTSLLTAVPFVIMAFGVLLGIIFIIVACSQHGRPQDELLTTVMWEGSVFSLSFI